MSGIVAVYGLVVSVLIAGGRMFLRRLSFHSSNQCFSVKPGEYSLFAGFIHLGAGLACGFTGMAAGYAIGIVGDAVSVLASLRIAKLNPIVCARLYQ